MGDEISRSQVVAWLEERAQKHYDAARLPRQMLPDRLRREGSAQTCRLLADQLKTGWGVPDSLKPTPTPSTEAMTKEVEG